MNDFPPTLSRRGFLAAASTILAAPVFAHARQAQRDPSFFVLGDWGKNGAAGQRRVSAAMVASARSAQPDFVITVGDNFYSKGVRSIDDPLWRTSFRAIYDDPALQCPWYPVLGNHDHRGNISAQVGYSQVDSRWHMPGRFYLTTEILSDGSEADFFFLDTTPIVEAGTRRTADATQIAWLQRELAGSTARWKVVVGHHPVFSGGRHGNDPAMIAHVKPLLERYGVSAYLAGHDHDLEHFAAGGVHYLTCGTGAETRSVRAIQGSLFVASRLGFLRARLDPTALHIAFVGTDGKNLHEAAIAPAS